MSAVLKEILKTDSIIRLIGNTPLIKLNKFPGLSTDKQIFIKLSGLTQVAPLKTEQPYA